MMTNKSVRNRTERSWLFEDTMDAIKVFGHVHAKEQHYRRTDNARRMRVFHDHGTVENYHWRNRVMRVTSGRSRPDDMLHCYYSWTQAN